MPSNYTTDSAHSVAAALKGGTDTICEVNSPSNVTGAYALGILDEATVDVSLKRLYEGLIRAGYFDSEASLYRNLGAADVNTPQAQALALQSAADAIVMKKNDGLLPLDFTGKSVAVIGFWANATRQMLGGYSGNAPYYHNPLYAARQLNLTMQYATGPLKQNSSVPDTWTENALRVAASSDIILYFGGDDGSIEAEDLDRYNITWPDPQVALISKLAQLGKKLVIVQMGDQNDDTAWLNNANISAMLWAGYPGQDGGTAVFDVMRGAHAPAGRLPVTQYPADYVNQVKLTEMSLRPGPVNPGRTYRWYNNSVLPFGHGMHYTTFKPRFASTGSLSGRVVNIQELIALCHETYLDLCPFSEINVDVTNTGNKTTSDFVALAFVSGQYGPAPYPIKTLAAYGRLRGIAPGQTAKKSMPISIGTLARTDDVGNLILYPGKYSLLLDVPTADTISFELTGTAVVLDHFPQPKSA